MKHTNEVIEDKTPCFFLGEGRPWRGRPMSLDLERCLFVLTWFKDAGDTAP